MVAKKATKNETAEARQAPADAVVAARSADGPDDGRFHKHFVVQARSWNGDDGVHAANKVAVLQEALLRGLHPRGDVHFDGDEDHQDGKSLVLKYSVGVLPAAYDDQPAATKTPEKALKDLGGSTQVEK
ncbi:hypothetical protein ACPYPG_21195 [Streptomyces sp. FR-108]|uniref:hypothetical protein n=1 Tax=Streptomyces sp. FR-108 TaxID=3416665 RepID=UPI003CEBE950